MIMPKVIMSDGKEEVVFYGFKNNALLKDCVAKQCRLLQPDSAIPANELSVGFKLVTSLCVEMWRMEKRLKKLHEEKPDIDLGSFFDQMQRIKDICGREGVVVKDYSEENYKEGISLKVLHFEDDPSLPPGISKIVETVRPTVFYNDKVIFHGEVVVAKSTQK